MHEQQRIVIRTGGGRSVGFGHLRRCLTLAQMLVRNGVEVEFLFDGPAGIQDLIATEGFPSIRVDPSSDLRQTCQRIQETLAQIVIVDSYDLGEQYLRALSREGNTVVAFDDLALHGFPVELVVNSSANAAELRYSALPQTRFLLGPQYVILREEFSDRVDRKFQRSIGSVLITMGGSDPWQLTPKVAGWILEALPGVELNLILGPLLENTPAVVRVCERLPGVRIHNSPQRVDQLMLGADVAISGGGQTCYELASIGTPTIAICMAENQRGHLSALSRADVLLFAGSADDPDIKNRVLNQLAALAENLDVRRKMARKGRQLVDGRGAKRVTETIKNLALRYCRTSS